MTGAVGRLPREHSLFPMFATVESEAARGPKRRRRLRGMRPAHRKRISHLPANVHSGASAFPVRGVPGGWRDWWDDPDDGAELRARAETAECRQTMRAEVLGAVWQGEIREERRQGEQERRRRGGQR
jgi:hypothetical protein